MGHIAETVVHIATHPMAIVGLLITVGVWVVLGRKILRLGAIISELRALPAQERRYNLERKYKIYPGRGNLPIAFARQRRNRLLTYLVTWTVVFAAVLVGVTARATFKADSIIWTLDDSRLVPEEFGYSWQIELVNDSGETVAVEQVDLNVLARRPHPETDRKRPEYAQRRDKDRKRAAMKPYADLVSIVRPTEQYFVSSRDKLAVPVFLDGYHPPHEGWIYDVQLVVQWQVPDETAMLTRLGSIYRIGWPGMPHWSEADSSAGPGTEPVTDPVVKVSD
jgi:hypothetical protein